MAVWKCGKCGGDLAVTSNVNVLECEFCGTRQTEGLLTGIRRNMADPKEYG